MTRPASTYTFCMRSLRASIPRAGPSRLPRAAPAVAGAVRANSTLAKPESSPSYPFSSSSFIPPPSSAPTATTPLPRSVLQPRSGTSVIDHINASLRTAYDPSSTLTNLFSRRHPTRLRPGSILTVTSYTNPSRTATSNFSGILMGIRRRGVDTSFTLRNVISRLGVETSFKIYSPMIKEVKIVKRAEGGKTSGVKDLKRAKVNYLRDRAGLMEKIAGALKAEAQAGPTKGKGARRR